MKKTRTFLILMLFVSVLLPRGTFAAAFSSIYIFGDSLSDTGNVFTITSALGQPPIPGVPYAQGRFSNGPNYAEVLASNLGHGPLASAVLSGGNNYAAGGARATSHFLDPILPVLGFPTGSSLGVAGQVQMFLEDVSGNADPNALYVFWGGNNDIQDALVSGNPSGVVQTAAQNLFDAVSHLVAAGAEHLLIPNVPDIGLTPRAINAGASGAATFLATTLNTNLDVLLSSLVDVDILRFDTFSLLREMVANPTAFGLTDVTTPCYAGPITGGPPAACAHPDDFLFWDDFHPTAVVHQILATRLSTAVVPEPATWMLLTLGIFGLLGYRRYKALEKGV